MKTKNLLKVLSLGVLLCGLAKVSSFNGLRSFESELFLESTQGTEMFDDCKEGLKLRGPRRVSEVEDFLASDVKVQISDIDENGNRAIRYVAAISSLSVDASFQRTIYNEDGSVFVESEVKAVEYAYGAIVADGDVVLPSSFGEEYNYFIVYTLANIPENYWFHRIDVSVNVNNEVSERKANIEGVAQSYVPDSNLTYSARTNYPGQYQVAAASSDITSAYISDYHVVYEDVVATRGKVTAIAKRGFAECNDLELLVIPSTISYFDEMCFYNVSSIKEVRYNASSATMSTASDTKMPNIETLKIGADVSKISNGIFSNNSIENLEYEGTKDEWNALDKGDSNYSLDEVKCEDSIIYNVIFHFDGATLNGNEGSYSYETHEGKTLVNPGKPEKEGESFDGWYLDENYETKFATVPASFPEGTEEVHVYAKFVADEGGMDAEHPLPLNLGLNAMKTTSTAMGHVYYSFTVDRTDNYTFKDVCTDSSKFTKATGIWLYSDDMTLLTKDATTGQFEITYLLEAGKTYIIKAGDYNETAVYFGSFQIEVSTIDGDYISEAKPINFNEDVTNTYLGSDIPFCYEYTPDGTAQNPNIVRIENTNTTGGNIFINLLNKETGEILDSVKFIKYTAASTSAIQNKDFLLPSNTAYVFEVYTPTKNKQFTFKLIEAPQGVTSANPFVYSLEDGKVSIPYSTLDNCFEESSKKYFGAYYKFVPTESFNGKLSIGNDSSVTNAKSVVEVYKDGVSIYTDGTASSPVKSPSADIDFVEGSVYIINVKSVGKNTITPYATTLSISVNSLINPDEGETDNPTNGDSLENPFVVEESLAVPSSIELTLEAGQTKYFLVNITEYFTDLLVDSGFEVKLYLSEPEKEPELLNDNSSDANRVLNWDAYDKGTYIIELYSKNGGTTTLELQDNYDIYNEGY